jgi:hypothetical protein
MAQTPPEKAPLVPTLTGNVQVDTALRYAAAHLGAAAATAAVVWMDAHGFDTKALAKSGVDMSVLIPTVVGGLVLSVGAWAWGQLSTKWSQAATVNNTVHAALTGEVPAAIIARASESQARAVEESPTTTIVPTPPPPSPAAKA